MQPSHMLPAPSPLEAQSSDLALKQIYAIAKCLAFLDLGCSLLRRDGHTRLVGRPQATYPSQMACISLTEASTPVGDSCISATRCEPVLVGVHSTSATRPAPTSTGALAVLAACARCVAAEDLRWGVKEGMGSSRMNSSESGKLVVDWVVTLSSWYVVLSCVRRPLRLLMGSMLARPRARPVHFLLQHQAAIKPVTPAAQSTIVPHVQTDRDSPSGPTPSAAVSAVNGGRGGGESG